MAETQTILLAGGGTGGHLYPGIAVAQALRDRFPHLTPLFLCTTREIDRVILEPTGFEFIPQPVVPWKKSISGTLRFAKYLYETYDLVKKVLKERKPVGVLGLGGYAAGVAVRRAAGKGVPAAILNPDVIPGEANRLLMKQSQAICCQFAQTAEYVDQAYRSKIRVTGCPIRDDIRRLPAKAEAAARLNIDPKFRTLVVTGASLGAQTVNEGVVTMLEGMPLDGWQVLHLSGREHAEKVRAEYAKLPIAARVIDFTPAMADVWAVADLAVSRSGASSCAELTACGVPSILMPYPFHKDMHQRANAKVLADQGAAILLDDQKDRVKNANILRPMVQSLLNDDARRQAMSAAARKLGKPQAAENVAQVMADLAEQSR
jgi:UDP-N-acetylglucosamine--N-acetylmuramyl-(pentapeptide) pyrophosphoryl-undecaprenol N-acetylglucosamine transferase